MSKDGLETDFNVYILGPGAERAGPADRVGMGFVVSDRHILTCAHVVAEAVGHPDGGNDERGRESPAVTFWRGRAEKPDGEVLIEFSLSSETRPVRATVRHWWPQPPANVKAVGVDDVAILELLGGFNLPPDVVPARLTTRRPKDLVVKGNGILKGGEGRSFRGTVILRIENKRWDFRSDVVDDEVDHGCSGAAILHGDHVVGMVTDAQGVQTAVFIAARDLLDKPEVAAICQTAIPSWTADAALGGDEDLNSVSDEEAAWRRTPLGVRLTKHLYSCDRRRAFGDVSFRLKEAVALKQPVIGVFGAAMSDMPRLFHSRCHMDLAARARGRDIEDEAHDNPGDGRDAEISWRDHNEKVEVGLARMKRELVTLLGADDARPDSIREALGKGRSRALYTEVEAGVVEEPDVELFRSWSDYLGEIGAGGSNVLLHLVCVRTPHPDDPDDIASAAVDTLVGKANENLILRLGAIPGLQDSDISQWTELVAKAALLEEPAPTRIYSRALENLVFEPPPRLQQLYVWLSKLQDTDIR